MENKMKTANLFSHSHYHCQVTQAPINIIPKKYHLPKTYSINRNQCELVIRLSIFWSQSVRLEIMSEVRESSRS